jgi:hypothetical protein
MQKYQQILKQGRKQTHDQTLCIKNEIKFLYKMKQDTQFYLMHIYNANTWQQTCINIEQSVNQKLQQEMNKIHKKTTENM